MRNLLVVLLAVLAVGMAACHDGGDSSGNGAPTVQSQIHWGQTECVDYEGCGDSIWLNPRLGQIAAHACDMRLCFGQSADEPECMYNCPTERLLARCQ